jgi:hypothetical protein
VRVQGYTQKRGATVWSEECAFYTLGKPNLMEVSLGYLFMCCLALVLFYVVFAGE